LPIVRSNAQDGTVLSAGGWVERPMTNRALEALAERDRSRPVRTLKDGYWDRTEVVQRSDGSLRVRKSTKGNQPGPWGVSALRREIEYLSTLPEQARAAFPPVLDAWDDASADPPRVGYELPFYADHVDAGELSRRGRLTQTEIDLFQETLADVLLERVHHPMRSVGQTLSDHVISVVEQTLHALEADPDLARLIRADRVQLNGEAMLGPRAAFARILKDGSALARLDAEPQVRLHGDLFLENTLWRSATATPSLEGAPRLLLIDPVSVAGVVRGPPWFDLVKYESYATGELLALRSEWVDVGGFEAGDDYHVHFRDAELATFRTRDWSTRLRRRFEAKYGGFERRVSRLIAGYFNLVMAINTGGIQRRARLLKATLDFGSVRVP
jgi:hypothetical protein